MLLMARSSLRRVNQLSSLSLRRYAAVSTTTVQQSQEDFFCILQNQGFFLRGRRYRSIISKRGLSTTGTGSSKADSLAATSSLSTTTSCSSSSSDQDIVSSSPTSTSKQQQQQEEQLGLAAEQAERIASMIPTKHTRNNNNASTQKNISSTRRASLVVIPPVEATVTAPAPGPPSDAYSASNNDQLNRKNNDRIQQANNAADALLVVVSKPFSVEHEVRVGQQVSRQHWRSLHRAFVCIISWCLDLIEHQLIKPASKEAAATAAAELTSTTTATTQLLLNRTLAVTRRAHELGLPLHLPLYGRLLDAIALHHGAASSTSTRNHHSSALHDMDTTTDLLLEMASHIPSLRLLMDPEQSCAASMLSTPLLILVQNQQWGDAIHFLTALKTRHGMRLFNPDVALHVLLLLRNAFRRQARGSDDEERPSGTQSSMDDMTMKRSKLPPSPCERTAMTLVALLEPTISNMIQQHEDEEDENDDDSPFEDFSHAQQYYSYPKPVRQFFQDRAQSFHRQQAAAILSRMIEEEEAAAIDDDNNDNHDDDDEDRDDIENDLTGALLFLLRQENDDNDNEDNNQTLVDPADVEIATILTMRLLDSKLKCFVSDFLRHAEIPSDDQEKSDDEIILPVQKSNKRSSDDPATQSSQRNTRPAGDNDTEWDIHQVDEGNVDTDDDNDRDHLFHQQLSSVHDLPDIISQVESCNAAAGEGQLVLTNEYKDILYNNILQDAQREKGSTGSTSSSSSALTQSQNDDDDDDDDDGLF